MKKRPQPEIITPKSIRLPDELTGWVEGDFWAKHLRSNPDADRSKGGAYTVLLRRARKYTDPETGLEKSPPVPIQLEPCVLVPCDPRCFHHYVNVNEFKDEGALKKAMDKWEGMGWADDPNGKNIHSNRELQRRTGLTADQFRDHGWKKVIHADCADYIFEEFIEKAQARQPFHLIYRLKCKDGSYVWIYDVICPRFYPDGSFAGFVGSMLEVPGPGAIAEIGDHTHVRRIRPLVIVPKTLSFREIKAS